MPQRSDLSRNAMKGAFAKLLLKEPIDKISVRQIVATAQVARSTFYRNFDDKEEFLAWLQADLVAETSQHLTGNNNNELDFTDFYRFASHNRDFLKAFLIGQRWPAFVDALYHQATTHFQVILAGERVPIPVKFLTSFILGGHIQMFETWLENDEETSPEQMNAYHHQLGNNLMASLQK